MAIELYFLRHAPAVEYGSDGFSEEERPLTDEGREKMILAVRGMKKLDVAFDALLSSPLIRAKQTAELVKHYLPFKGSLEIEEELAPDGTLKALLKKLSERGEESFLLVGHEPNLSTWIQSLLGCGRSGALQMKKGALCHLRLDRPEEKADSELIALLQPKVLRQSGRKSG